MPYLSALPLKECTTIWTMLKYYIITLNNLNAYSLFLFDQSYASIAMRSLTEANMGLLFGKVDPILMHEDMALRYTSEELKEMFFKLLYEVGEGYKTANKFPFADPWFVLNSLK